MYNLPIGRLRESGKKSVGIPVAYSETASRPVGDVFPSNNFARHRGLLRARPYGNRRREDRRERRSSNHIVEEHERGNMNNISARRTAGESRGAERERRCREGRKREKPRERGTLGRQRLRRRKKREGARVGTTPWLVGSFDLLPPRDGPLLPAIPLRAGPLVVSFSPVRRPISSSRSACHLASTRLGPLSSFSRLVISHLRRRGVRHVRITPSTTTRSLIIRSSVLWSFSWDPWNPSRGDGRLLSLPWTPHALDASSGYRQRNKAEDC